MSLTIPLSITPNQTLSVELGGFFYVILLQSVGNTMAVTISRDDALLMSGIPIIPNAPMIPFERLGEDNFVFLSSDDQLPNYLLLDVSQFLIYLTADEMAAAK